MNEIDFRNWLTQNGENKKVVSDLVSRLKRIERELNDCDIDEEYKKDRCEHLSRVFAKQGNNDDMKFYATANFPIGKYHMNVYRYALKKYITFVLATN